MPSLLPSPRLATALCLAVFLVGAIAPALHGIVPGQVDEEDGSSQEPLKTLTWSERISRDGRIDFTRRSVDDAWKALRSPGVTPLVRAEALLAIGCTRPEQVRQQPVLEAAAREGDLLVRQAAILALGELNLGVTNSLVKFLEDPDADIRACAMLALLRTDRSFATRIVDEIASGGGEDALTAARLLVYSIDPGASHELPTAALHLRLRWGAARRFGLVDGQPWRMRVLRRLLTQPRFLDAVVLRSAADETDLGVKDHLLSVLIEKPDAAALRAAAVALPNELGALLETGLWKPRNVEEWRLLLSQIDQQGNEDDALGLLGFALEVRSVSVEALRLLARAGVAEALEGLESEWPELSPRDRRLACEAWAIGKTEDAAVWLDKFKDDPDPEVRAAIMLARARLGDPTLRDELEGILDDPKHKLWQPVFLAYLRAMDDPASRESLEDRLEDLKGGDLTRALTELALHGVPSAREKLAEVVSGELPRGLLGTRVVRALAGREAAVHSELLSGFFPVEDDIEVNIELARTLLSAKADIALQFLRPALWKDPFDRSVLAGLLVVRVVGLHGLRDELTRVPLGASSRDLRRIGFALGEWGGLGEVKFLQTRRGLLPGDPVLQGALLGALGRRTH